VRQKRIQFYRFVSSIQCQQSNRRVSFVQKLFTFFVAATAWQHNIVALSSRQTNQQKI
jgi:hypothetical protein